MLDVDGHESRSLRGAIFGMGVIIGEGGRERVCDLRYKK
jgi:hypothetical protein